MSPARTGRDATPAGSAPAVVRAVAVLDALAADEQGSLSLSDIARVVGVPKSSTATICAALEAGGLVTRDGGGYALGPHLVLLGGAYLSRVDRGEAFRSACAASPALAHETVRLWALGAADAICLGRHEGHPAVRLTVNVGDRLPASVSAAGKIMLAQFDDHEIAAHYPGPLPRLTAYSHAQLDGLLADVRGCRERGYAIARDEASESVTEVAVVVPSRGTRTATMAISVTRLSSIFDEGEGALLADALRDVAAALGNPMQRA